MRLSFILSSLLLMTDAKRIDVRKLKAKDVGAMHTDAFEQLAEIYKDKSPENDLEIMMEVTKILEGYCGDDDLACKSLASEATMKEFHAGQKGKRDIKYSDAMHGDVKLSLEKMFETLKLIDDNNLDEIVDTFNEISNEISDHDEADEYSKVLGVATVSLAVESVTLWHNVHTGSMDHPLASTLVPNTRRKLQSIQEITDITNNQIFGPFNIIYEVTVADVSAGLNNGGNLLNAIGTNTADMILGWAPAIVISVLYFAVPASVNKAIDGIF